LSGAGLTCPFFLEKNMKIILLLFSLFLVGCGNIPVDKTPAPFDNNFYTQELRSCEKTDVGLLVCPLKKDGELVIPTLLDGEYDIKSNRCAYAKGGRFSKSNPIRISYDELTEGRPSSQTTCIFDVKVFMDKMDRGMRGIFVLTDMEEFKPLNVSFLRSEFKDGTGYYQLRRGHSPDLEFLIRSNEQGWVVIEGCGIEKEFYLDYTGTIRIGDVIPSNKTGCILRFGLIPDDNTKPLQMHTFLYQNFSSDIVRLPTPTIEQGKTYWKIKMAPEIAFMSIGGKTKIFKGNRTKTYKFKYKKDQEYLLRIGTANGRYSIYTVKNGVLRWKTSIQY
jgi:hypothetical protein